MFSQIIGYVSRLMSGGTLEIVLLIVLIVVALILFLVALWIVWKLLVLLGKGLLWLIRTSSEKYQVRSASRRQAMAAAPPDVATSWSAATRLGLRRALAEARRLADPDALRLVIVSGKGSADLFRGMGMAPPGPGTVGIAAAGNTVLIDASGADEGMLGRLARALPWRRPVDGIVTLVDAGGVPGEALGRASAFARQLGMRTAMHFVFPVSDVAAWQIIDARNRNGDAICSQLAMDAGRTWLTGGQRTGLKELALAQSREMPHALDRVLAAAPSSVDIASLSLGGSGLRAAVAQTTDRTQPVAGSNLGAWTGLAVLVFSLVLTALAVIDGFDRANGLRGAVDTAAREAAVPWAAEGIGAIPSGGRVHRVAGTSLRLSDTGGFSPLTPLGPFAPNSGAASELGAAFLESYLLVPLADALRREARRRLVPTDDPVRWIEEARLVSEWLAAYDGLENDPAEVDVPRLLTAVFGGDQGAWPEGIDLAMIRTGARPRPPTRGGLDIDGLTADARENFVAAMQQWADSVYTMGPVATAARQVIDRSSNWREQHDALLDLRAALQDPAQQWLTATEDRPDYSFELRILGRAVALPLLGPDVSLDARAAVSRTRIDAREAAERFILRDIGPLMVRSTAGGGGGASLVLSPGVEAWLAFLDRLINAGFGELPTNADAAPLAGPVTLDAQAVAAARNRLRVFDQFASDLPADLSPAVAQRIVRELASELVVGVMVEAQQALRPANPAGTAREYAERLVRVAPALEDLLEIELWLRERQAQAEAERVLAIRGRVVENVLAASTEALDEEDPLGIHLDPAADSNALVRRFERGLARLRRIQEQYASPFIDTELISGEALREWRSVTADIDAHQRGDGDSALAGLEGMVRSWAESQDTACEAPPAALVSGRTDYVARALSRFRGQVTDACRQIVLAGAMSEYEQLVAFFERYVVWQWPYSDDRNAPDIQPSTLDSFVARLLAVRDSLPVVPMPLASDLAESAAFWTQDEDGRTVVRFRIDWRSRPADEQLAEHIIEFGFEGVDIDEDGVYTWRYGAPFEARIRLAKNSSYRFLGVEDPEWLEWDVAPGGSGALLRLFEGLSGGDLTLERDVVDAAGVVRQLRVTARITYPDGRPMSIPAFSTHALMSLDGEF